MTCSTTLGCWINAHPVVAWVILGVIVVLIILMIISTVRSMIRLYKMDREAEARREESYRESKALSRQLWRTIRQSEEWNIDVTELRQAKEEVDFRHKAARFLEHRIVLIFFPALPIALVSVFLSFVLVEWVEFVSLALFMLAAIWGLIQWGRYRWWKRQIKLILDDLAQRPATPPDASTHV